MKRLILFAPLLWTLACDSDDKDVPVGDDVNDDEETDLPPDTDTDTDTVEEPETDETDTDAEVGIDTDGGEALYHVVLGLAALPKTQGFDIDGDGDIDNAIGQFAAVINPLIDENYGNGPLFALTQVWGVDSDDMLVDVGVLGGEDTDMDPSDNGSGTEPFELYGGLLSDGHAPIYGHTELDVTGAYETIVPPGTVTFGTFVIPISSDIHIMGIVDPASHVGRLGGAVSVVDLTTILDTFGLGALAALFLPDIDVDGDGTNDAISAAFSFDATSCELIEP